MKTAALFALALLALSACTTSPPPGPTLPDPATQMGALENRIEMLVEQQRLMIDPRAKPLMIDPELAKVARARAADMAAKNYLAHEGPNRETSASLLMAADAQWQGLLGENLAAQHYTKLGGVTVEDFAQRFLQTWLNSQPHKDNLAFADYDRTGVGAAVNGDTVYVAQLFSTNLGLKARADKAAVTRFESPRAATAAPSTQPAPPLRLRGAEGVN
jgi:uncharacterized protein YkwD